MATLELQGKWALVTGASAGIGTALARDLARRGANLVLTARRLDRLNALAAELRSQGREVLTISADLNQREAPQVLYAATEGAGIAIDILVNNAGLGQYGSFRSCDLEQELTQIRVNCEAVVHITRLFVPKMVARRRGWILLVASTASFQPVPFLTTYAATKGFDRYFALGLAEELAPFGINVAALCPGPTESEFFEVAHAQQFRGRIVQSAEVVARKAIDALLRGQRTIIPYFSGWISALAVRLVPTGFITWFVAKAARPKDDLPQL